ncbi:MAG: putative esterase [Frankiales bacterium]|nr:putative esterase [Frankiales bacterium]
MPEVLPRQLVFRLSDPERRLAGVRLQQDVRLPGEQLGFTRSEDGTWELRVPRPGVDRMEYSFELQHEGGGSEWVTDPANPARTRGAFGDKSVLEMPEYAPPVWLAAHPPRGPRRELALTSQSLAHDVPCVLWAAEGLDDAAEAPLLVVHDGPEYDALASLTLFLDAMVADARLPPLRAALLAPVDRNDTYAASSAYGRALALGLVPRLRREVPTGPVLGMGASLGGLAMLHAQRAHPGTFAGLYLQSSSFFHRYLDGQESGFDGFARIAAFVDGVTRSTTTPEAVPVVLTCGQIEENVDNNRLMTSALQAQGYDTRLVENRDVHTYVGWRDTFDPNLVDLVQRVLV